MPVVSVHDDQNYQISLYPFPFNQIGLKLEQNAIYKQKDIEALLASFISWTSLLLCGITSTFSVTLIISTIIPALLIYY